MMQFKDRNSKEMDRKIKDYQENGWKIIIGSRIQITKNEVILTSKIEKTR